MRFLTVATTANAHLGRLLKSAEYHRVPLEVIGMGHSYRSHRTKIDLVLDYASGLDPEEPLLFVDGYDTVFLTGPQEMEAKFAAFGAGVVFSAEQNLLVSEGGWSRLRIWWHYPETRKPYRFANSGTYVGLAGRLAALWRAQDLDRIEQQNCDQSAINRYYRNHPEALVLDVHQEIFAVTAGRTGLEDEDYEVRDGRLRSTLTGRWPCVLHCPSKNYIGLEKLIAPLPFASAGHVPSAEQAAKYRASRWRNRMTARTTRDNFLFHFLVDGLAIALGCALAVWLLLTLAG